MKATRKSISTILCMLVFAFACMIGVNAKAASPEGLFSVVSVTGGVKITGYSGAEDTIDIPAKIKGKNVVEIGSNFIASDHRSEIYNVIVPNTVTTLGNYAFSGCTNLQQVTLGAGVTSIGSSAFEGCSSLKSINYPSKLRTIGSKAFFGCSFSSVSLPGTVETVGDYAYGNMKSLYLIKISNGTKTIGNNIAINCPNLYDLYIPSSVTSIGATLVPSEDVALHIYKDSYAMKYVSDKSLNNKIVYLNNVTPSTFKFKEAKDTNRKYVFYVGESIDLSPTLSVSSGNTNAITWSSSKSSVFTVDRYGRITAKGAGTATLVAKASVNPSKSAYTKKTSVNITVKKAPTKVSVTQKVGSSIRSAAKASHKIETKGTITLAARTTSAEGAPIYFTSSDTKVATVGKTRQEKIGKYTYTVCTITGVAEGNVEITAKTYNGKKVVYELAVETKRTAVAGNWGMKNAYAVVKGNVLEPALKTISGMPKEVKFKSSNTTVATVNANGVVTAKKPGIAVICAYAGTQKAETTIYVLPTKIKVTSATSSSKHKITLKWKKQAGVSGYQIRYKKSGGKWSNGINVSSGKSSYTTKKLTKGKKYYIQVRGFVKNGKTVVYGGWSTTKSLKVK